MRLGTPRPRLIFYVLPAQASACVLMAEKFARRKELVSRLYLRSTDDVPGVIQAICDKHGIAAWQIVDLTLDPAFERKIAELGREDASASAGPEGGKSRGDLRLLLSCVSSLLALLVLGVTIGAVLPIHSDVVEVPAAPIQQPARVGLGLTRGELVRGLTLQDYAIQPDTNDRGVPRWMARNPFGIAELIGPEDDLSRITLIVQENRAERRHHIVEQMTDFLGIAFPHWRDRHAWAAEAVATGEGAIVLDAREAQVSRLQGVGLILSIGPRRE